MDEWEKRASPQLRCLSRKAAARRVVIHTVGKLVVLAGCSGASKRFAGKDPAQALHSSAVAIELKLAVVDRRRTLDLSRGDVGPGLRVDRDDDRRCFGPAVMHLDVAVVDGEEEG